MTERFFYRESENFNKRDALLQTLRRININFPVGPQLGSNILAPREWLIRGESVTDRIMKALPFTPQAGQMGSRGVFLGDCSSCLAYPDFGFYYLFQVTDLDVQWLVDPSPEYNRQFIEIVKRENLDQSKIGDGLNAESQLYSQFSVYQSKSGICTIARAIDFTQVYKILVRPNTLDDADLDSLATQVKNKLVLMR